MAALASSVVIAVSFQPIVTAPLPETAPVSQQEAAQATSSAPVAELPIKKLSNDEEAIKAVIAQYAADLTAADRARIAAFSLCESGYSQFDDDGKPLYSGYGTPDVGALQINIVHEAAAKKAGYDIDHSLVDNVRFGIGLYRSSGSAPWENSKACWNKPVPGW